jgi:hypothetical protein
MRDMYGDYIFDNAPDYPIDYEADGGYEDDPDYRALYIGEPSETDTLLSIINRIQAIGVHYVPFTQTGTLADYDDIPF